MKNLCLYGVVELGVYTGSGLAEMHAAFRLKRDAVAWLKQQVPNAQARRNRWRVVSLALEVAP